MLLTNQLHLELLLESLPELLKVSVLSLFSNCLIVTWDVPIVIPEALA